MNRLRVTVATRILISFLVVLSLFALASVWSVASLGQASSEGTLLRKGYLPLSLSLRDLVASQDSWNSQLNHVTAAKNPADARVWFDTALSVGRPRKLREVQEALRLAFHQADDAVSERELSGELDRVARLMEQDRVLVRRLFEHLAQEQRGAAQNTRDELVRHGLRVQQRLLGLEQRVTAHVDRLLKLAAAREETAWALLIFLSGLTCLVGVLMTLYVARVLSPLSHVTRRAERVAAGDLSSQEPIDTGDEIGELSATFESMVSAIFEAREKLLASERLAAIGKMAAHVTHEVRNPLSSIALNLDLLADEVDENNEEALQLVAAMGQEVARLSSLTDQYLSMARRRAPEVVECDLAEVVRGAGDFLRAELEHHGIVLEMDVAAELPLVPADASQLRQVLFNLMRNAREAMPEGGRVRLLLQQADGEARIVVEDSGPGVPEDQVAQLFDPFYTTKSHGTGLGLAVSSQILRAHGGMLAHEPRQPQGARFVIRLPLE